MDEHNKRGVLTVFELWQPQFTELTGSGSVHENFALNLLSCRIGRGGKRERAKETRQHEHSDRKNPVSNDSDASLVQRISASRSVSASTPICLKAALLMPFDCA